MIPRRIFTFQRTIFDIDESRCFVMMPFNPNLDEIYQDVIKPVVESEPISMRCIRADEVYSIGTVLGDIWDEIQKARVIIADLTSRSPNVFYELGLAHAIKKNVIIITKTMDDVPFDTRHIVYKFTSRGVKKLEEDLRAAIESLNVARNWNAANR